MLFRECKPGMIINTPSGGTYLVVDPRDAGKNAYRLDTKSLYWVLPELSVEHIGYLAIETIPVSPAFISVPHN